jgi:hypothetical protein
MILVWGNFTELYYYTATGEYITSGSKQLDFGLMIDPIRHGSVYVYNTYAYTYSYYIQISCHNWILLFFLTNFFGFLVFSPGFTFL